MTPTELYDKMLRAGMNPPDPAAFATGSRETRAALEAVAKCAEVVAAQCGGRFNQESGVSQEIYGEMQIAFLLFSQKLREGSSLLP